MKQILSAFFSWWHSKIHVNTKITHLVILQMCLLNLLSSVRHPGFLCILFFGQQNFQLLFSIICFASCRIPTISSSTLSYSLSWLPVAVLSSSSFSNSSRFLFLGLMDYKYLHRRVVDTPWIFGSSFGGSEHHQNSGCHSSGPSSCLHSVHDGFVWQIWMWFEGEVRTFWEHQTFPYQ